MTTSLVRVTIVTVAIALLLLSTASPGKGIAVPGAFPTHPGGGSSALVSLGPDGPFERDGDASRGFSMANSPPFNPANCSQGSQTIVASPGPGDMHDELLQDYDTLGAAGGGTLKLSPGVFFINETLEFWKYGDVSIQGSGMGRTVLSLPPSPIGNFTGDNGTPLSLFNQSLGGPANGVNVNFIQVVGGPSLDNFEMCDLSLDAEATNASEDWAGSVLDDPGGGIHHVYSDIAETGLYGPSGTPNGIHIDGYNAPALGYVIDNLYAVNDSWPNANHTFDAGGPNFLNTGDVTNCTEENITGIGNFEFEVAPSVGCTVENVYVTGHMLIDPIHTNTDTGGQVLPNGSWGGTLFQNVTLDDEGTGGPNAMQVDVPNGENGSSDFSGLSWNDDHFVGGVIGGRSMVDVTNSTFDAGINSLPAVFEGNTVTWVPALFGRCHIDLPIDVDALPPGGPVAGTSSLVSGNVFVFPNGTETGRLKFDPFQLTVPQNTWSNDTIEIAGATSGYLLSAPGVAMSQNSSFFELTYNPLGNGSPPDLVLVDMVHSPGFQDLGAVVDDLIRVENNLPLYFPTTPTDLTATATSTTEVALSWNASYGPVTNYTVLVGASGDALVPSYSAGLQTEYLVHGLAPGEEYFFGVEAWNFSFHSAITNPIEVTTAPLPNHAPSVPTGLTVTYLGTSEVGIRWSPSTGTVTNYTIDAGTDASTWTLRFSAGTATGFTVTGLDPATTYYFAVEAWNGTFASGRSAPVNATTLMASATSGTGSLPGTGPMSVFDWGIAVGTMLGTTGVVVVPLIFVSRARTAARARVKAGTAHRS